MNIPYRFLIELLNDPDWKRQARSRRPREIELFDRFAAANGPQCPFARAALKQFYALEYSSNKEQLINAIQEGNWK